MTDFDEAGLTDDPQKLLWQRMTLDELREAVELQSKKMADAKKAASSSFALPEIKTEFMQSQNIYFAMTRTLKMREGETNASE